MAPKFKSIVSNAIDARDLRVIEDELYPMSELP
jgi:hypothetical protein